MKHSEFTRSQVAAIAEFQSLLYRLFGVFSWFRSPMIKLNANPGDFGRAILCDWIRKKPGMLMRCDESEKAVCGSANNCWKAEKCHMGFVHAAFPVRIGGRTVGHLIVYPFKPDSLKDCINALSSDLEGGWFDVEYYEGTLGVMPKPGGDIFRRISGFVDTFFSGLFGGTEPAWESPHIYHVPIKSSFSLRSDAWVNLAWGVFEKQTNEPPEGGWLKHRSHQVLVYAVNSSASLRFPDGTCQIKKGWIYLIPPGAGYNVSNPEREPFWVHFVTGLDLSGIYGRPMFPGPVIRRRLRELISLFEMGGEMGGAIDPKTVILEILEELRRSAGGAPVKPSGRGLRGSEIAVRLKAYLDSHPFQKMKLEDLAKIAGVNIFTLSRMFSQEMGVPPLAYHRDLKIRQAIRLLHEGELSVKQVAARVGIDDQHYLSRVIKKHTGMAPRALRGRSSALRKSAR